MRTKRRKTRLKIKKIIFSIFLAIAIIIAIPALIYSAYNYIQSKNNIQEPVKYYLFIGTDESDPKDADSIMLLALNENSKEFSFISIPGNTKINTREQKNKLELIKDSYAEGGSEEIRSTVENLLHIRIDKYAVLNYSNFEYLINKLDGLNLYVEKEMNHVDANGNTDISLKQGYQSLNGNASLSYVRFIDKQDGELGRVQRQERLLKTLISNIRQNMSLTNWMTGKLYWKDIDTNITSNEVASILSSLTKVDANNIKYEILPGEKQIQNKNEIWVVNPVEVQKTLAFAIEGNSNKK